MALADRHHGYVLDPRIQPSQQSCFAGAIAGANAGPLSVPILNSIEGRLKSITQDIEEIYTVVLQFTDRTLGSEPVCTTNECSPPQGPGQIGGILDSLTGIADRLRYLRNIANRLNEF